jgi:hypothetical protein
MSLPMEVLLERFWKTIMDAHDLALTADIAFLGQTGNEPRKAVLMIRPTLDANSPYA